MQRITDAKMKIEHLEAQDGSPRDLAYANLLAACPGNEGSPRSSQTCDTRKGDQPLRLHPLSRHCEQLTYATDGRVLAGDPSLQSDLDSVLNLNDASLVRARTAAVGELRRALDKRFGAGAWSPAQIAAALTSLRADRPFRQFLGLLEFWLERLQRKR